MAVAHAIVWNENLIVFIVFDVCVELFHRFQEFPGGRIEAGCDVPWYIVAMREIAKQRAACRDKS